VGADIHGNLAVFPEPWASATFGNPQNYVAVAFARATQGLEPVGSRRAAEQQDSRPCRLAGSRLRCPLGNVASIAAKASAVIEIVTMRLMWF
jgi:hypothetical protein